MKVRLKVTASSWLAFSECHHQSWQFRAIQADIRVARVGGVPKCVKKQNRKQKQRNSAMGCRTSVREDSRVLLERCDRLCVVEVMSGVYHDSEFPSCARSVRPAGVIHSVPAKNRTKKAENKQRNSVSSWGAGPKISVVLCKDANSWFGEMLVAFVYRRLF